MAVRDIVQAAAGNVGNPNAWDTTKAYYDAETATWDITNSYNFLSFNFQAQSSSVNTLFFKPDGTKMFLVSDSTNAILEYSLSAPWMVNTAAYVRTFGVGTQDTNPSGLFFKPDGTKMYMVGYSTDNVNEYNLSTPWDLATASYSQNFSVATEETTPRGIYFKPDGTKMYIAGTIGDAVFEYNLSTAWDITTASYLQNLSVVAQGTGPADLSFSPDGTIMFVLNVRDIDRYTLSTPWDVTTASFVSSIQLGDTNPRGIFFPPDGFSFYIVGLTSFSVIRYTIGGFNLQPYISGGSSNVFFNPDGTKMYQVSLNGARLNEFTLSTPWDTLTATFVQYKTVTIVDTDADAYNAYGVFFKPDGTKFYLAGQNLGGSTDFIWEWSMSVPWDVSTATFVYRRNIEPQAQTVRALSFSADGTKVYFVSPGASSDVVVQFSLGSPWSTNAAGWVYDSSFSVASQEADPTGIFFKPDGTKMFITGTINDDVKEYTLSTPWDVSTASFLQTGVSMQTELPFPRGLFFKPDGTQFWTVGFPSSNIRVLSYPISPI